MTRNEKLSSVYVFMGVGLFLIFAGFLTRQQDDTIQPQSTVSISPTATPTIGNPLNESLVNSWRAYANDQYNFSIEVPAEWVQQEYPQTTGGFLVAFAPHELPCSTCTYFRDGYFSVKVYNEKTDSEPYRDFKFRMENISKIKDYQAVQLSESKGLMGISTFAIEHGGAIFEISLDINDGNSKISESKILQKVITSLKFNELQF